MSDPLCISHDWGLSAGFALPSHCTPAVFIGAHDVRHLLQTITQWYNEQQEDIDQTLYLHYHEHSPASIARLLLLLTLLLDDSLFKHDRVNAYLQCFMNIRLSHHVLQQVQSAARSVLQAVHDDAAAPPAAVKQKQTMKDNDSNAVVKKLKTIVDLKQLSFKQRDGLVEQLEFVLKQHAYEWDMTTSWDMRLRKLHGQRYDFRHNVDDWDYHMRLVDRSASNAHSAHDSNATTVGNFSQTKDCNVSKQLFMRWRSSGIGYIAREDEALPFANPTLLTRSTAQSVGGFAPSGKPLNRSVSALGYWGDVRDGPFHSYGAADDAYKALERAVYALDAFSISQSQLQQVVVSFSCEDPVKRVIQRKANAGAFQLVFVGFDSAALVTDVTPCVSSTGKVVVERGTYVLALDSSKLQEADNEIADKARTAHLQLLEQSHEEALKTRMETMTFVVRSEG